MTLAALHQHTGGRSMILFILVAVVSYLLIGSSIARLARPKLLATATYRKGDEYLRGVLSYSTIWEWQERPRDGIDRGKVLRQTWCLILGWPVTSWVYLVNRGLTQAADRVDPAVHKRQQKIIRDLERELEINR